MKYPALLIALFLGFVPAIVAQNKKENDLDNYNLSIRKSGVPIKLDGLLDEAAWTDAQAAQDFMLVFPNDTALSPWRTIAKITFDDNFLYVGGTCYQKRADYTIQNYRRDYGPGTTDVLNVMFDPTKDGLNGFLFSVSPYNVQREGLISNGDNLSLEWDNKWYSAVQNYDDYWTVEMAIPFKTLRYNVQDGVNIWGLQFIRTKVKDYETSVWRPVALQYRPTNVGLGGKMTWETPPPKPGMNISFIPYAITGMNADYARDSLLNRTSTTADANINAGFDAKVALTPGLNLDITFNPDFSQVEVDRQVANLSRFELFFPETRQFFLENRDLFALYGFPESRPFFSRRIGLAYNPEKGRNEKVPIIAGVRLSGKLTNDLRIGVLNMQTAKREWSPDYATPQANYTVATAQHRVFSRSTISAIFVNKINTLSNLNENQREGFEPWNRVAGLEYNLYSKDNRWEGEWYYHRSLSPNAEKRGDALAGFLGYRDRFFNARMGYNRLSQNYTAEMGFVPRPGVQSMFPGIGAQWYPKSKRMGKLISSYNANASIDATYLNGNLVGDNRAQLTDASRSVSVRATFVEQSAVSLSYKSEYTYLFNEFDPTNLYKEGTQPLPVGGYTYNSLDLEMYTGSSYNILGSLNLTGGEFFNGHSFRMDGQISYRWQPIGLFTLRFNHTRINLPSPYPSAAFWLVGPRIEVAFNRNLFISTFIQYNTQANNINVNARLQWRFAPVSDLFLVYTDNSYAEAIPNSPVNRFSPKDKSIVLKGVYWFSL